MKNITNYYVCCILKCPRLIVTEESFNFFCLYGWEARAFCIAPDLVLSVHARSKRERFFCTVRKKKYRSIIRPNNAAPDVKSLFRTSQQWFQKFCLLRTLFSGIIITATVKVQAFYIYFFRQSNIILKNLLTPIRIADDFGQATQFLPCMEVSFFFLFFWRGFEEELFFCRPRREKNGLLFFSRKDPFTPIYVCLTADCKSNRFFPSQDYLVVVLPRGEVSLDVACIAEKERGLVGFLFFHEQAVEESL